MEQRKRRTDAEQKDLERITELLDRLKAAPKAELADPLFVAARDYFNDNLGLTGRSCNHDDGKLGKKRQSKGGAAGGPNDIEDVDVVKIALVLGLMAVDGAEPPRLRHVKDKTPRDTDIEMDRTDPAHEKFSKAFFAAFGETQGVLALARKVLPSPRPKAIPRTARRTPETSRQPNSLMSFAVSRKGIDDTEPQLSRRVNACLDKIQNVGVTGRCRISALRCRI